MPVDVRGELRIADEGEIVSLAYDLMGCVFQLHNELGRFSNELSYKRLVAKRFSGIDLEVPVVVSFQGFEKTYRIDTLVRNVLVVEWKAVERFAPQHRAQLLNYLLLCELPKGKLVNTRGESVKHEFVNTTLTLTDRRAFHVDLANFVPLHESDQRWSEFLLEASIYLNNMLESFCRTPACQQSIGSTLLANRCRSRR